MKINSVDKKKWILLGVILLAGFLVYILSLTASGLWYDEAIEYYFSKVISGKVPGGFGKTSMYERILSTYQPPLYNWLMHIWLIFFDSETGFRMAGVVTTLLGAIGIFCGIDKITNYKWAAFGTCLYVFSTAVACFGLECAEYNLMLCCISWTIYFYIMCIKNKGIKNYIGFFLFACLSVYSQYGAAFLVIVLYLSLIIRCIKEKDFKVLKQIGIISAIVAVVAAFPLIYFFMLPQMNNQGSATVSHTPYFKNSNIIVDFIISIAVQAAWNFHPVGLHDSIIYYIQPALAGLLGLVTLAALFNKSKTLKHMAILCISSWIIFYIAVACSFYGYNGWVETYGTENMGTRYGLFFIPLWVFTLSYGMYVFSRWLKKKANINIFKGYSIFLIIILILYTAAEVKVSYSGGFLKEDIREISSLWYKNKAYEKKTLVHEYSDAVFQFYLTHNNNYKEEYQDNIVNTDMWIRSAGYDELKVKFEEMGIFELEEFYYISRIKEYEDYVLVFEQLMKDSGYEITTLWNGKSVFLYLKK
ncbi:MAG: glycosyltransferase family 39 protein [Lachnospiraceae bacterium]|nr:glycosyltransferase family 39 protein [Lachnospiraceae bacterium]